MTDRKPPVLLHSAAADSPPVGAAAHESYGAVRRQRVWMAAKIGLSLALLAAILYSVDPRAMFVYLRQLSPGWLLLALIVMAGQMIVISWRWSTVMGGLFAPIRLKLAVTTNFIAVFFSQALPTSIAGDAWRVWRIRQFGHATGIALGGVILDRVGATLALGLVVTITLPGLLSRVAGLSMAVGAVASLAIIGVAIVLIAGVSRLERVGWERETIRRTVEWIGRARALILTGRIGAAVLAAGVVVHLMTGVAIYLIAAALGVQLGLVDSLVLTPPVILLAGLPVSIAGWGVREGVMVTMLGYAGASAAGAVAVSVVFGLALLALSLPGGLMLIADRSARRHEQAGRLR